MTEADDGLEGVISNALDDHFIDRDWGCACGHPGTFQELYAHQAGAVAAALRAAGWGLSSPEIIVTVTPGRVTVADQEWAE
jgi:hypothetical protein